MPTLRIDMDTGNLLTSDSATLNTPIKFTLESYMPYTINFVTVSNGVQTGVDVSNCTTWKAYLDCDFNHSTSPMVSIEDQDDFVTTDSDTGTIIISVDCDTTEFETAVGTKEKIDAWFQICGFNVDSKMVISYIIKVVALNSIKVQTVTT